MGLTHIKFKNNWWWIAITKCSKQNYFKKRRALSMFQVMRDTKYYALPCPLFCQLPRTCTMNTTKSQLYRNIVFTFNYVFCLNYSLMRYTKYLENLKVTIQDGTTMTKLINMSDCIIFCNVGWLVFNKFVFHKRASTYKL